MGVSEFIRTWKEYGHNVNLKMPTSTTDGQVGGPPSNASSSSEGEGSRIQKVHGSVSTTSGSKDRGPQFSGVVVESPTTRETPGSGRQPPSSSSSSSSSSRPQQGPQGFIYGYGYGLMPVQLPAPTHQCPAPTHQFHGPPPAPAPPLCSCYDHSPRPQPQQSCTHYHESASPPPYSNYHHHRDNTTRVRFRCFRLSGSHLCIIIAALVLVLGAGIVGAVVGKRGGL